MSVNQAPAVMEAPDHSAWLVVAGLFEILVGCFCLYLYKLLLHKIAAHYTLPTELGRYRGYFAVGPSALWQPLVIYAVAALAFIWLGIGLMRARRWAWSMTVACSWVWLVLGAVLLPIFVFLHAPAMWNVLRGNAKPVSLNFPNQAMVSELFAWLYVGVPGVLLLICHDESARATCRRRDPKTRWTDRCPLPVLVLSLMLGTLAVLVLSPLTHQLLCGWESNVTRRLPA